MLARIWNYNKWITITDDDRLVFIFDDILKEAGFNILGIIDYKFTPQGYTRLYLLGESHFAIHTFPEEGKTYIELSSCNEKMFDEAVRLIKERL